MSCFTCMKVSGVHRITSGENERAFFHMSPKGLIKNLLKGQPIFLNSTNLGFYVAEAKRPKIV